MIAEWYKKTFAVLAERPVKLWGLSLLEAVLEIAAWIGFIAVPAVGLAVSLLLRASYAALCLGYYRKQTQPTAEALFTAFKKERIWRVLGGMAWRSLWVFLWLLIPLTTIILAIVAGLAGVGWLSVLLAVATLGLVAFPLIRSYAYCFVPFILMTREDVRATEAITISRNETMGYKGRIFLAVVLPRVLVALAAGLLSLLGLIPILGYVFKVCQIVLQVVYALIEPLLSAIVLSVAYDEIQARRAAPPAPPAPPVIPIPTAQQSAQPEQTESEAAEKPAQQEEKQPAPVETPAQPEQTEDVPE